jgi:hypothetical protein
MENGNNTIHPNINQTYKTYGTGRRGCTAPALLEEFVDAFFLEDPIWLRRDIDDKVSTDFGITNAEFILSLGGSVAIKLKKDVPNKITRFH